jgi:hypothetical protein
VAGYSDEALEELFPGTLESFIKPTLWLDKPSLTQHFCRKFTMICGSNIPSGSSQMGNVRCVILTKRA